MATARVLVVDDDRAVRESLQRALQLEDLRGRAGRRRHAGPRPGAGHAPGPGRARRHDAGRGRARGRAPAAPGRRRRPRSCCSPRATPSPTASPAWTSAPTTTSSSRSRSRSCSPGCARCCAAAEAADDGREVLRFADVELDTAAMRARRGDRDLELTRTEFDLLELFLANPRPGPHPRRPARPRLGLRRGDVLEHPGGLRGLPAAQARGGRRTAPHPDRPRRRLRAAAGPGMSLRGRIADDRRRGGGDRRPARLRRPVRGHGPHPGRRGRPVAGRAGPRRRSCHGRWPPGPGDAPGWGAPRPLRRRRRLRAGGGGRRSGAR